MNNSDKHELLEALTIVFELYGKPKPSMNMVAMYFEALRNYSIHDVKASINLHVRDTDSGQFLPKPADIIRSIDGNKDTKAELAWSKVHRAIRHVGPDDSLIFDDGLIHAVIDDMGGWIRLCMVKTKEMPFKHNEFIKRYSGFINRPPDNIPRKLIGQYEVSNSAKGYKIGEPLLIGDPHLAKLVHDSGSDIQRMRILRMDSTGGINKLIENITKPKESFAALEQDK